MLLAYMALCIKIIDGFPAGAPDIACVTMTPGHGNFTAQSSNSPFSIIAKKKSYSPGETLPVLFTGGSRYFKGLYVQARSLDCSSNDSTARLIGQFTTMDFDLQTRHCCGGLHNAVTQSVSRAKNLKKIYWTAPVKSTGHVIFRGTFVEDYKTFWTEVYSDILVDLSSSTASAECILKYKRTKAAGMVPHAFAKQKQIHEQLHVHSLSDIVGDLSQADNIRVSPILLLGGIVMCAYLVLQFSK